MIDCKEYTPKYTAVSTLRYIKRWIQYVYYRNIGIITFSIRKDLFYLIIHLLLDKTLKTDRDIREELISLLESSFLYAIFDGFKSFDVSEKDLYFKIKETLTSLKKKGVIVELQEKNERKYCLKIYYPYHS